MNITTITCFSSSEAAVKRFTEPEPHHGLGGHGGFGHQQLSHLHGKRAAEANPAPFDQVFLMRLG